jgi:iron complex transport system permease protein
MYNIIVSVALLLLALISTGLGVATTDFTEIFTQGSHSYNIFVFSRIPRTISIIVAGFGMSICGLIMQQLTMNKFVSPTTAGTSEASKFGILIAMLFFPYESLIFKMVIASCFAMGGTFLFLGIIRKIKAKDNVLVPLIGIMMSGIISSLTMFFAYKGDMIQNLSAWLFGDFSGVIKGNYELLYLTIPLVFVAFLYSKKFTISGLGEEFATNLGINYKYVVNVGLALVCIISSLIIITIGSIPFLGLIIPNIVSMFNGDNVSKNIYLTGISGSSFLLFCDIGGRLIIYPHEIQIGLVSGVIGSGIFLILILRRLKLEY